MEKIDRIATGKDGDTITEWLCKVGDKLDEIVEWINKRESSPTDDITENLGQDKIDAN